MLNALLPAPQEPDVFDSTLAACQAAAAWNETPVALAEVESLDVVRPAGWCDAHAVLDIEPLPDGFARVLWRCDAGDEPPGPATVFRAGEHVLRRGW